MALSVLLIEDDPNIARLLDIYLGKTFSITRVSTAREAASTIAAHPYDVVLLDVNLPDRPGWDLLDLLTHEHPDTHVLVMTGLSDNNTYQRAMAMGARQVLVKPLTPAQVKAAIDAL